MIGALWSPYEVAMKLGAIAAGLLLLVGLGAWGGYAWQADEVEDAKTALAEAVEQRDGWRDAADQRSAAITAQNKAHAQALKDRDKVVAQAEAATRRANAAAERFLQTQARIEREHAAEAAGKCAAVANLPICGVALQ